MADKHPQEWKSRREIPDPRIRDAADQYEQARKILRMQPPGTGVVLPMMNAAAMAIELYLKCLAAEVIHVPEGANPKASLVYAQASTGGHKFIKMFYRIDEDHRLRWRPSTSRQRIENSSTTSAPLRTRL